jgi:hypothetical protein
VGGHARPPAPRRLSAPWKLLLVAVGTRMPAWVDTAFDDFAKRMRELPLQLVEVKAEPRTTGKTVEAMMAAEAARIEAALPPRCRRLILDERGEDLTTKALAGASSAGRTAVTTWPSSSAARTASTRPSRPPPTKRCASPASPCPTRWSG